jgi:hypothetical protein
MTTTRATLEHRQVTDPLEDILEVLDREGAVIVEGLLSADVIERVNRDVDEHLLAADPTLSALGEDAQQFFGTRTRHVPAVAAKSPTVAAEVVPHPVFMGICDHVLLPSCDLYQLNLVHLIAPGPGAQAQMLHRDQLLWHRVPKPRPEILVASIIALVDFTVELGATRLVPGSHRWESGRKPEPHEVADAEMPAGSAVVYLGSTYHGAGANSTADRWRRGIHMSYVLGWLRTEENLYLSTPPEVVKTMPRRTQELMGYARHGGLGSVDMRDPVELLATGELW